MAGEEKKCVHQYKPPEVGIAEPKSACRPSFLVHIMVLVLIEYHSQSNDEYESRSEKPTLGSSEPQDYIDLAEIAYPNHSDGTSRYRV